MAQKHAPDLAVKFVQVFACVCGAGHDGCPVKNRSKCVEPPEAHRYSKGDVMGEAL